MEKKINAKYCGPPSSLGVRNDLIENKKAMKEITDNGVIYLKNFFNYN